MPAEWEPHRATWIAWPHHEPDWPGQIRPDSVGLRGDRARASRCTSLSRSCVSRKRSSSAAARDADAHAVRARSDPLPRGAHRSRVATRFGTDRRARPARRRVAAGLGVQRLGEVRQLGARRSGRNGDRRHHRPSARRTARATTASASCSRAAASTSTATGSCSSPRSGC